MKVDNSTDKFRLFVAISIPEPVRDEIIRVQRELEPLVPRAVARWTRPDQFHLTLRFLGDVGADRVKDLKKSVEAVCQRGQPLSLRAEGVGFFPNPRSPRVIWVGIDGAGRLMDLQRQIETAVNPYSSEPGEKNFTGHVTLGRLQYPRPADTRTLAVRAQAFEKQQFGEWTAQEVEIVRSELSSNGARHTVLASFRLGEV